MQWQVALCVVASASVARADSTRRERPLAIGLAFPDELVVADHDVTVPLPTLHVGYAFSPLISLELGVGGVPMPHGGHALLAHVGARQRLTESAFAPFVMSRFGVYDNEQDEGPGGTYPFALVGGGLEYVRDWGLALWIDVGAGVAHVDGLAPALAGSLGVSFRR